MEIISKVPTACFCYIRILSLILQCRSQTKLPLLKSIFILLLVLYFLISFSGKIIRFLYWLSGSSPVERRKAREAARQKAKARFGDVEVELPTEKKNYKGFQGGEYVDYEEVK